MASQAPISKMAKKKLPRFEVSSSYETYAQNMTPEGYFVDSDEDSLETVGLEEKTEEPKPEKTFEEKVDSVVSCVTSQNPLREILYKILVFCADKHEFGEVETFISSSDEFVHSHIIQTPYTLIQMLIRADGLERIALDENGEVLTEERCTSLTEDERDDLICSYQLIATEAGTYAASLITPEARFNSLIARRPHREETFYAVLEYCLEPRKLTDVQAYFKQHEELALDTAQVHHKLAPDFYLDKLEQAGVLVWKGAWQTNDTGRELLEAHRATQSCE